MIESARANIFHRASLSCRVFCVQLRNNKCGRVVAFGDAINDIPMFQIADECYAVENAVEELKALATGIITSNEQDGVAKWLLEHAG